MFYETNIISRGIKKLISIEKDLKVKLKFIAINTVAKQSSIPKVAELLDIPERTLYRWVDNWNLYKREGLVSHYYKSGRKSILSESEMEQLKKILSNKGAFTTEEARSIIYCEFKKSISSKRLRVILKEKLKFNLSKPYVKSNKRPDNAEEILSKKLKNIADDLKKKDVPLKDVCLGFLDETTPQSNSNTVRFWHKEPKLTVEKHIEKWKNNNVGFYALRGNSCLSFMNSSKKEEIGKFLQKIRAINSEFKRIILILDNFKSHHSKYILDYAEKHDIILIFLPPYSPDLNPIEFIWKSIKREISKNFF